MSEPWRGLHNHERHRLLSDGSAICDNSDDDVEQYWGCIEDCSETDPCKCCLAAEVEVLRSALSGLGQRVFDAENTLANVRDWADRTGHYAPGSVTDWQRGFLTARWETREILDGGDA